MLSDVSKNHALNMQELPLPSPTMHWICITAFTRTDAPNERMSPQLFELIINATPSPPPLYFTTSGLCMALIGTLNADVIAVFLTIINKRRKGEQMHKTNRGLSCVEECSCRFAMVFYRCVSISKTNTSQHFLNSWFFKRLRHFFNRAMCSFKNLSDQAIEYCLRMTRNPHFPFEALCAPHRLPLCRTKTNLLSAKRISRFIFSNNSLAYATCAATVFNPNMHGTLPYWCNFIVCTYGLFVS